MKAFTGATLLSLAVFWAGFVQADAEGGTKGRQHHSHHAGNHTFLHVYPSWRRHCPTGLTKCGKDDCVDLLTDWENCGSCYDECEGAVDCNDGACCPESDPDSCGGVCTNWDSDPENCGSCGNACEGDETCSNGMCSGSAACVPECEDISRCIDGTCMCPIGSDSVYCDGKCINPTGFCGSCGYECPKGIDCNGNQCCSVSTPNFCGRNGCVSFQTDDYNCGSCGNACEETHICLSSECECSSGQIECGGKCVDPYSDADNCGGCGNHCPSGKCSNAMCTTTCTPLGCSGAYGDCGSSGNQDCLCGQSSGGDTYCFDNFGSDECPQYDVCTGETCDAEYFCLINHCCNDRKDGICVPVSQSCTNPSLEKIFIKLA
ncbi:hypothetical protein B0H66DRAFT_538424 [Apodospora peruviana]|uniref:Uncharacterized protein n=1 Tax=Apodospora peruviana TaxID=516989 RepID=A0AAE0HSM0_9PEZI|nr:hypothetical protein B0H66DRAFT_538424 [Apodospora peruviana]